MLISKACLSLFLVKGPSSLAEASADHCVQTRQAMEHFSRMRQGNLSAQLVSCIVHKDKSFFVFVVRVPVLKLIYQGGVDIIPYLHQAFFQFSATR